MVKAGTAKSWMDTAAPGSLGATRRAIRYSGRRVLGLVRRRKEAGADFAAQGDGCAAGQVGHGHMHLVAIDRGDPDPGMILLVVADFGAGGEDHVSHYGTCSTGPAAPTSAVACALGETSDGTRSARQICDPISFATPMTSAQRLVGIRLRLCHPCTVV